MPHPKPTIARTTNYTYNSFHTDTGDTSPDNIYKRQAVAVSSSSSAGEPPLHRLRNKARKFLLQKRKERYYKALEEHTSIYSPTERRNHRFSTTGTFSDNVRNSLDSARSTRSGSTRNLINSARSSSATSTGKRFHFNEYSKSTSPRSTGSISNSATKKGHKLRPASTNSRTALLSDRRSKEAVPDYSSLNNNSNNKNKRVTSSVRNTDVESFFDPKDEDNDNNHKSLSQAESQSQLALSPSPSIAAAASNRGRGRKARDRAYSDYNSSRQHQREQRNTFHLASVDSSDSFLKITFTADSAEGAFEAVVDERFTSFTPTPTPTGLSAAFDTTTNTPSPIRTVNSGPSASTSPNSARNYNYNFSKDDSISEDEQEDDEGISFAGDNSIATTGDVLNGTNSKEYRHVLEDYDRTHHHTMTSASSATSSSSSSSSNMRRKFMKCMHCLTQNTVTTCIFRIPTVADYAMASYAGTILDHPKFAFLGLMTACVAVDAIIILPGWICSKFMTEWGVYLFTFATIWYLGRCVLRMIAFPGATPRLRGEVETEFAKYSIRMLKNATESCADLATLLISMESASMYSMENGKESMVHGVNVSDVLGSSYGRFDVIPLWKKASQYRDRVMGMYHDILHCLLTKNGDGKKCAEEGFTKYGNNPLIGDIGKLISVSEKAKTDGMELHGLLGKLLEELESLEKCASSFLDSDMKSLENQILSRDAIRASQRLLVACSALMDCLESMYAKFEPGAATNDDDSDDDIGSRRRKSAIGEGLSTAKEGVTSVLEMVDPSPFKSIFGLDSLRGAVLSRYRGAQQFWVPRAKSEGSGMIDAFYIPADGKPRNLNDSSTKLEKVVLFCNPNAGLLEVATGLSIIGGNIVKQPETTAMTSWTDFYLDSGFDIILFNYTGYGRSHVGKIKAADHSKGCVHFLRRMLIKTFFAFKPSPSTLKADATAVATFILEKIGVESLVMHGESIGGMAASGASRTISHRKYVDSNSLPVTYPSLLIADRTFCNLDATASRLVGNWTDSVIPMLTPFWNTDVAGDFAAARCKKVLAQDASDAIIHDASSLKKGVSSAKEFMKEATKSVHKVGPLPVSYRMSDYENVGVLECTAIKTPKMNQIRPPKYPADKHISLAEGFHFAACSRRIGKVATQVRKNRILTSMSYDDDEEGIEIPAVFSRDDSEPDIAVEKEDVIVEVWEALARCDGLTGMPLGGAVKEGYDSVLDWLSCIVTLGCQRVALAGESRIKALQSTSHVPFDEIVIAHEDFDFYYPEYDKDDDVERLPPLPLPDVITLLQNKSSAHKVLLNEVQHELDYCIQMLQYLMNRISSKQTVTNALKVAHFQDDAVDRFSTGRFLNLSCGHNNQYSAVERIYLSAILTEALEHGNSMA